MKFTFNWIILSIVIVKFEAYRLCTQDNNLRSEPNIGEIIDSIVPKELFPNIPFESLKFPNLCSEDGNCESLGNFQYRLLNVVGDSFQSSLHNLSSIEVDFMKVISDGIFTIEMKSVPYTFNDIYLIQENYFSMNYICILGNYLGFQNSIFCRCITGVPVSGKEIGMSTYRENSANYCSMRPCSDNAYRMGKCIVTIDPYRQTCINILAFGADDEQLSKHISYRLDIPNMSKIGTFLRHVSHSVQKNIENFQEKPEYLLAIVKMLHSCGNISDKLFSLIPQYLFNLIVGTILLSDADSIASSKIFQFFLVSTMGMILALAWIVVAITSTFSNTMKQYVPYSQSGGIVASILMFSYFLKNSYLQTVFITELWKFWDEGWFGLWWLGKAYFLASVIVAYFLMWMFSLFTPKSTSLTALRYSIKLIGVLLLVNSTSNKELSIFIIAGVSAKEVIGHFLWTFHLYLNKSPSHYTTKMTMSEFEEQGKLHTDRALLDLKRFLLENPKEADKYFDRLREGGKHDQAKMMQRFLNESYPGRPYTSSNEDDDNEGSSHKYFSSFSIALFFISIALLATWLIAFGGWSKLKSFSSSTLETDFFEDEDQYS